MLYATVDFVSKKTIIPRYQTEEILGEVKIRIPQATNLSKTSEYKRILKKLKKFQVQNVVLNEELSRITELNQLLIDNKKYIVTGNRMSKALLPMVLDEIAKLSKYPSEKMKVLLLMNEYSIENIDLIECIALSVKQLSIISKNYTKYEKTAGKLYEQYGFMVKLYDITAEEMKREHIIINLDFTENEMKRLTINRNSIVISLNEKIGKVRKSFQGIIIQDLDILGEGIPKEGFHKLSICEARLYRPLRKVKDNEKVFEAENYKINGYIGNNGKITEEEFENIAKNFT